MLGMKWSREAMSGLAADGLLGIFGFWVWLGRAFCCLFPVCRSFLCTNLRQFIFLIRGMIDNIGMRILNRNSWVSLSAWVQLKWLGGPDMNIGIVNFCYSIRLNSFVNYEPNVMVQWWSISISPYIATFNLSRKCCNGCMQFFIEIQSKESVIESL